MEEKPARKRGRPRKVKSVEPKPPKKPGRPVKPREDPNVPFRLSNEALSRIATAPGDYLKNARPLKPREAKFVEIFAASAGTKTMKECAVEAGYKDSYAGYAAGLLTDPNRNPHIVAAIQRRQMELNVKYGTTYERHMRDLQYIRDKAIEAGAWAAAVQAEYRRGQALGTIYIDRKEIRHGTIDSMSKEEVQKKLDALRKLYQGSPDVVDAKVTESIEREKQIDHTEEFLNGGTGEGVLSEGEEGDDECENNEGGIVGEPRDP